MVLDVLPCFLSTWTGVDIPAAIHTHTFWSMPPVLNTTPLLHAGVQRKWCSTRWVLCCSHAHHTPQLAHTKKLIRGTTIQTGTLDTDTMWSPGRHLQHDHTLKQRRSCRTNRLRHSILHRTGSVEIRCQCPTCTPTPTPCASHTAWVFGCASRSTVTCTVTIRIRTKIF